MEMYGLLLRLLHPSSAGAFSHFADSPRILLLRPKKAQNVISPFRCYDHGHANAHIENVIQLVFGSPALIQKQAENRQHLP